jgi:hypothetical protein
VGSFNSLKYSEEKQGKAQFCFQKKQKKGEMKICEGKELKKHLSIANKRRITGYNEEQLKAIN